MIRFMMGKRALFLQKGVYENERTAIVVLTDTGSRYAVLTVNFPGTPLDSDEVLIKTWSENTDIAKTVLETGLFIDTGRRIRTGFYEAQVWKVAAPHVMTALSKEE